MHLLWFVRMSGLVACQLACRLARLHVTSHVGLRRWNAVGTSLCKSKVQRMQHYGDAALLSPIFTVFHQISSCRLRSPNAACSGHWAEKAGLTPLKIRILLQCCQASIEVFLYIPQDALSERALSERAVSCMAAVVWQQQSECTS